MRWPRCVVLDTETTGLPLIGPWRGFSNPLQRPQDYAHVYVLSLGYAVSDAPGDAPGDTVSERLLSFPGVDPEQGEAFRIHGITRALMSERGEMPETVLREFHALLVEREGTHLVGHNVQFDVFAIAASMARLGMRAEAEHVIGMPRVCTMHAGTPICRLPGRYGNYKWPKLSELHQHLFGCGFEGAHSAAYDVRATLACFDRMREMGCVSPVCDDAACG